ncbi:hypothetical protein Tco_0889510, partial [Tanacetum coccineum]
QNTKTKGCRYLGDYKDRKDSLRRHRKRGGRRQTELEAAAAQYAHNIQYPEERRRLEVTDTRITPDFNVVAAHHGGDKVQLVSSLFKYVNHRRCLVQGIGDKVLKVASKVVSHGGVRVVAWFKLSSS